MNPISATSNFQECSICLNEINTQSISSEEKRVLDCSHIFHRECIGTWLKQKPNCPLCRADVMIDIPEDSGSDLDTLTAPVEPEVMALLLLSSIRHTLNEARRQGRRFVFPIFTSSSGALESLNRIFRACIEFDSQSSL